MASVSRTPGSARQAWAKSVPSTPQKCLSVDHQGGNAVNPSRNRLLRVFPQGGLDRFRRNPGIGVDDTQRRGQGRPIRDGVAALGPDEAEDGVDGGKIAVQRDGQAQDAQRVERMGRRHPERARPTDRQ